MYTFSLEMTIIYVIFGFVLLNAVTYYSMRYTFLPGVIWVLLFGMLYGAFNRFGITDLPPIDLDPYILFFILVPILIFAASKKMCLYHFRKVLGASLWLATAGILISASIIAIITHVAFDLPLLEGMLIGAILSATDPIAVGAILHEAKTLQTDKKMLIEGESILNDGFVVALFAILTAMVFAKNDFTPLLSTGKLILDIIKALLIGLLLGRGARALLHLWKYEGFYIQINMTLALAFAAFFVAEHFHLPGILSVFASALSFGYKPEILKEEINNAQESIWEYLEYLANTLLFFLLGESFFLHASLEMITFGFLVISIAALFFSRLFAIGILYPLLCIGNEKLTRKDFWILNFSGSRGAISIALILLLPNDFVYKSLFLTLGFVMVLVSLVFYPMLLKKVL